MKKKGIRFLTNTFSESKLFASTKLPNVENFDMVMEAIGRIPNITNLNFR